MVDLLSIPEAAKSLDLSPGRVHALVARGQIPALKIGGRWAIERAAVEQRRRDPAPSGRPFAAHNAWAVLLLASGEEVEGIDPSVRSRLRRHLALEGLERLGPRLSRRAEHRHFEAHPGEISYLLNDRRLVRSGVSAAAGLGFDLLPGAEVDGYLRAGDVDELALAHALRPTGRNGNVRLRLVPDSAWRFLGDARVAPRAAVALDLAEDPDPRSSAAGMAALRDWGSL